MQFTLPRLAQATGLACLLLLTLTLAALPSQAQDLAAEAAAASIAQAPDLAPNSGFDVLADTIGDRRPRTLPRFTDSPAEAEPEESSPLATGVQPESRFDDQDNNTPTAWWVYAGQSGAQVSALVNSLNARIVDLALDPSTGLFTVTMVQNTGAYNKAWWWSYGMTAAQVGSMLTANNARPISLKSYLYGGQVYFAVVMVSNTGVDAKKFWWYSGESAASLQALAAQNKARLVTLDPELGTSSQLYTGIMVADSGLDAGAWWAYANQTPAALAAKLKTDGGRVAYLSASTTTGNFNAVVESCAGGCPANWWYYGDSSAALVAKAGSLGARLVDTTPYPGCGGSCYAGAMISNTTTMSGETAIAKRVAAILSKNLNGGFQGLYLKQVGGPVLAAQEDGVIYEPASSIKPLAGLLAMSKVQKGTLKLTTPLVHYTNGPESCPNPAVKSGTEPLDLALREMLWHSDNARTREFTDTLTDAAINSYAASIGMTHSSINHIVGCGGPIPDALTLDDADKLYEGVAQQTLLNAANRGVFYSSLAGRAQYESEGYDWTHIWDSDLPAMINQVAPAGTTAAQKAAYMSLIDVAYKAGNYLFCQNQACTDVNEDLALTGWFQLPVCSAAGTTYKEYVWGIYLGNVYSTGYYSGKQTQADADFMAAKSELMREQLKAAMASCNGRSLKVLTWSPSDLVFTAARVGSTSAVKSVTVTNHQSTAATGLTVTVFGDFAQTNNCGTKLAAGASCTVKVSFKPTATGERTGAVILGSSATGEPETIQLTGTGS